MRDLQRSMLVHGVDLGEVADICVAVEFKDVYAWQTVPQTYPLYMGKTGTIWQFFSCFVS